MTDSEKLQLLLILCSNSVKVRFFEILKLVEEQNQKKDSEEQR